LIVEDFTAEVGILPNKGLRALEVLFSEEVVNALDMASLVPKIGGAIAVDIGGAALLGLISEGVVRDKLAVIS
jgi:hypothetical protein